MYKLDFDCKREKKSEVFKALVTIVYFTCIFPSYCHEGLITSQQFENVCNILSDCRTIVQKDPKTEAPDMTSSRHVSSHLALVKGWSACHFYGALEVESLTKTL